jgi:hypothetical protein
VTVEEAREGMAGELRRLAVARRESADGRELLATRTRRTIEHAQVYLTMTEIARLLEMDRSAMYRTFVQ